MQTCRVCGEEKEREQFFQVTHFSKYKKQKVIWCRDCQKMFIKMKKEQKRLDEFQSLEGIYCVSFE